MGGSRAVVVTGASTGIGEACALRMAERGYAVFAGVRRDEDGERLKAAANGTLTPIRIDVTKHDEIAAAAETVGAAVGDGGLWGLVNNAGIVVAGPLEFVPIEELRKQLEINVVGQMAVTRAFLPQLRRARGRIVNIGSIAGRMATPFVGPYGASKHAMEALSDALRFELAPFGIEVSLVEPGAIQTPIWKKSEEAALAALDSRDAIDALYGPQLAALQSRVADAVRLAIPASKVADVVEHALTARRPKTRYLVGFDAHLQAWARRWAPDRLRDRLIRLAMKMPKNAPGG